MDTISSQPHARSHRTPGQATRSLVSDRLVRYRSTRVRVVCVCFSVVASACAGAVSTVSAERLTARVRPVKSVHVENNTRTAPTIFVEASSEGGFCDATIQAH